LYSFFVSSTFPLEYLLNRAIKLLPIKNSVIN